MRSEILEAMKDASEDDDIRVVVIKGAGKGFCAEQTWQVVGKQSQVDAPAPNSRLQRQLSGGLCKDHVGYAKACDRIDQRSSCRTWIRNGPDLRHSHFIQSREICVRLFKDQSCARGVHDILFASHNWPGSIR